MEPDNFYTYELVQPVLLNPSPKNPTASLNNLTQFIPSMYHMKCLSSVLQSISTLTTSYFDIIFRLSFDLVSMNTVN